MPVSPSSSPEARPLPPLYVDRGEGEPISLGANLVVGKKVAPDILNLLADDHRTVLGWFDWYGAERDTSRRAWILEMILRALRAHMAVEEEIFYPAIAKATGDTGLVDRAIAEHKSARQLMALLPDTTDEERIVRELRREILAHIEVEEDVLFAEIGKSGLDRFAIGALAAARRVEVLFELACPDKPNPKETPPMASSQDEARKLFVVGLRNIHGTVREGHSMVETLHGRVETYPKVKAKLAEHLREKKAQLERIESILGSLGESRSMVKDAAGALSGMAASMMASAADDEILKGSFTCYGLANFEAAAYETLITMAQAAGHPEHMPTLQLCLSEERGMAAFIAENLRGTGLRFMQLRSEGHQSKR